MNRILLTVVIAIISSVALQAGSNKSNVGQQLPKIDLKYVTQPTSLEGKPAIIEFWATWCPPCRQSIPHLNELYKKYHQQGLQIVGVTREEEEAIVNFIRNVRIDYSVAIDSGGVLGDSFEIKTIPHALLVDKKGKVVWEGSPFALTQEEIDKVMK